MAVKPGQTELYVTTGGVEIEAPANPGRIPVMYETTLRQNLEQINERISAAADRAHRDPQTIRLLPVTKYHSAEQLIALANLGYNQMAENRVQEIQAKQMELAALGIDWVMIGRLQTNKVKALLPFVSEIQSVDSTRLAKVIQRNLPGTNRRLPVLLQVNTSGEESKSGFTPAALTEELPELLETCPNLLIRGLMTMAPIGGNTLDNGEDPVRDCFRKLATLRETLRDTFPSADNFTMDELSMGMSGDFEIAIEEGATIIRVGSAVFAD